MSTELVVESVEDAWRNSSFAASIQQFLELQEKALKPLAQGATEINDSNDPEGYVEVSSGKHKITVKEHIKRSLTEAFNRTIWTVVRDSLNADPDIKQSSEELGIESYRRIVENAQGDLEFDLLSSRVESWRERHSRDICSRFTHAKSDYTYTRRSKAGQVRVFYDCHHRGEKQVHKFRVIGGKTGKSRKRGDSIKCGCPAKYSAVRKTMPSVEGIEVEVCRIIYNYRHNHTLGGKEDVAMVVKSEAIGARIRALLHRSPDLQATMRRMLMSYCDFFTLPSADAKPPGSLITYNDVYQLWYDISMDGAQKYPDEKVSSKHWMEELSKEGYFTCCTQFEGLYYAFSSSWQLEQLKAHGSTLYFDGLHQIANSSTSLYTILVRDGESDRGIPVAFMITRAMDLPLSQWLTSLKEKMLNDYQFDLNPTAIVTDQSTEEITTLKTVFPSTQVLFCPWQAFKDWERKVPLRISASAGISPDDRPGLAAKALTELYAIAYEPNHLEAMTKVTEFRQAWTICPELLEYVNNNFFIESAMLKWMLCFRQGALASRAKADRHVVKAWHHQTKIGLFTYHRNQQSDWLIALLQRIVIPYYHDRVMRGDLEERAAMMAATVAESSSPVSAEDVVAAAAAAAAAVAAAAAAATARSTSSSTLAAPTTLVEPPPLPQTLPSHTDESALLQAAVQEAVKEMHSAAMAERDPGTTQPHESVGSSGAAVSSEGMSNEDSIGHLMSSIIELCGRRSIAAIDDTTTVSSAATIPSEQPVTVKGSEVSAATSRVYPEDQQGYESNEGVPTKNENNENNGDSNYDNNDTNNNSSGSSSGSSSSSSSQRSERGKKDSDGGVGDSGDTVGFYANRLAELYTSRTIVSDFPQRKEVELALKRAYEVCSKYLSPEPSSSDSKVKRQRQHE